MLRLALAGLIGLAGCGRSPAPADDTKAAAAPATATPATPAAAAATPSAAAMVLIRGGSFTMGEKDEADSPPHEVTVGSFLMDAHLVTQEFYQRVMADNPARWKNPRNPVEQVRWSDAVRFCNRRSQLEGRRPCYDVDRWTCDFNADGYRLPTEAEWEYACRAGSRTTYFFDATPARLGDYAWFERNAGGRPHPVGEKKPNAWGLYDMCGNVWQWCHDLYQVDYYTQSPATDPRGPETGKTRVVRGGSWRSSADNCRAGYRYNENPGYADVCFGYDIYGFRCVRKADAPAPAVPAGR